MYRRGWLEADENELEARADEILRDFFQAAGLTGNAQSVLPQDTTQSSLSSKSESLRLNHLVYASRAESSPRI